MKDIFKVKCSTLFSSVSLGDFDMSFYIYFVMHVWQYMSCFIVCTPLPSINFTWSILEYLDPVYGEIMDQKIIGNMSIFHCDTIRSKGKTAHRQPIHT